MKRNYLREKKGGVLRRPPNRYLSSHTVIKKQDLIRTSVKSSYLKSSWVSHQERDIHQHSQTDQHDVLWEKKQFFIPKEICKAAVKELGAHLTIPPGLKEQSMLLTISTCTIVQALQQGMKSQTKSQTNWSPLQSVPTYLQKSEVCGQSVWMQTKLFFIRIKLERDHWKPLEEHDTC